MELLPPQQERRSKKGEQRKESRVLQTSVQAPDQLPPSKRVGPLVRHHAVHLVDGCCERAQTHLLRLVNDLRARLHPLFRDHQVFVGVHQEVKGTWTECTVAHTSSFLSQVVGREKWGNSQGVSSSGRKVTVAVICLMTERISS